MPKTEMKQLWAHTNEQSLLTLPQGTLQTWPILGPGAASGQRIGQEVQAQGFHIRGVLYNNSGSESYVRQIFVGYPTTVDVLASLFRTDAINTSTGIASLNGLDPIYFPLNKTELKIYHDKTYKLAGSVSGTDASNTRTFSRFIKLNGKKIVYKGTDTTPDNWLYGLIHIVADANDDTSTGTAVEISNVARFFYRDG